MNAQTRRICQQALNLIAISASLMGLVLSAACSTPPASAPQAEGEVQPIELPTQTPTPSPTAIPTQTPTPIPPTPTPVPITLNDIAAEIASDVGVVTTVVATELEPAIFIFEERHDSMLGQVEIAIMLNRLYTDYELRHIGLEGHMADAGPLDLAWAHRQPYYQPDQPITNREDVMTQTLQDGEIGSAELIGLIYHDVVVDGIDNAELYAFEPPKVAWIAPDFYLYYTALAGMSDEQRTAWEALYAAEQYDEAFEFAISSDEFTAGVWERLSDPVNIISAEEWLTLLDEMQTQAELVGAEMTTQDAAYLGALVEYFEYVSQRSDAMAAAMLDLTTAYPESPLAMTIGTLHTARVVELFSQAGVSFAVIRPRSLAEGDTTGLLSAEAYQRKQQGLSVAPDGFLGSYLDGRKKPGTTADKKNYLTEELIRELAQNLAARAAYIWENGTDDETDRLYDLVDIYLVELSKKPEYKALFDVAWVKLEITVSSANSPVVELEFEFHEPIFGQKTLIVHAAVISSLKKPVVTLGERLDLARKNVKSPPNTSGQETICSDTAITGIEVIDSIETP